MTFIDIILVVAALLLFLLILGLMRETVILHGHVTALSQLITNPPIPSFIGKSLPHQLARELPPVSVARTWLPRAHVILFLRSNCGGCEDLVAGLEEEIKRKFVSKDNITCVVAAASVDSPVFRAAQSVSRNTVLDVTGDLLKACEIQGTPTQLAIWTDTLNVFDYNYGGDVEWIRQKLQQQPERETVVAIPS